MSQLTFAFFGNPPLAIPVLEELEAAGSLPALIITEPDRPGRRGKEAAPAAVRLWGEARGIEVLQPESLKDDEAHDLLMNSEWDLFVVASYGTILPKSLIEKPQYDTLNVHPSLLPKLRGPSPVRSAILKDQKDAVGVTIIKLDEKMDHGPIVAQASMELEEWPLPAPLLEEMLAREGGALLAEILEPWIESEITPEPQKHREATYCGKITNDMGELDLTGDAYENYRNYCALYSSPGTYFIAQRNDKQVRVKIVDAEFTDGEFRVLSVVPEGKKEMSYEDFLRGS